MLEMGFRCVHSTLAGLLALGAGVLTSVSAAAQVTPAPLTPERAPDEPAPSAEEPEHKIQLTKKKPMIDLATPEPAAPEGRTYHVHDGFSVRLDGGLGTLLSAKASTSGPGGDVKTSGLTLGYDLLVGGAPSPGFVLGGGLSGSLQLSGDWELGGGAKINGGNLSTFVIGPFAEGYPDANGGLHFGGMVGLARLGADTSNVNSGLSAIGVGGAFWAGSGVWVAPDWSIGGLLRLDAATGKDDDVRLTSVGLSLMFSVLYN